MMPSRGMGTMKKAKSSKMAKAPGKVVKRSMGGGMPSQSQSQMAAAQAAQLAGPGGLRGGPPPPPPPTRSAGGMRGAGVQAVKKGGSVKKLAKGSKKGK